ncbi:hypothetical protein KY316_02480, partial [Candidatus Woesearchaeota archaeon]|nr:hypothetical protein [Candidatus Woesearchaeota archaeon]
LEEQRKLKLLREKERLKQKSVQEKLMLTKQKELERQKKLQLKAREKRKLELQKARELKKKLQAKQKVKSHARPKAKPRKEEKVVTGVEALEKGMLDSMHKKVKSPVVLSTLSRLAKQNVSVPKPKPEPADVSIPQEIKKQQLLKEVDFDKSVGNESVFRSLKSIFSKSKEPVVVNFKSYDNIVLNTDKALHQKDMVDKGITRNRIKSLNSRKKKLRQRLKKMQMNNASSSEISQVKSEINKIDNVIGGKV